MYTLTYISCNMHNYTPNQPINVAKLCLKSLHECGGHVNLT